MKTANGAKSTVWKNENFSLTKKIFRQINSLLNYFSKTVTFTKFLPKMRERIPAISTLCELFDFPHLYTDVTEFSLFFTNRDFFFFSFFFFWQKFRGNVFNNNEILCKLTWQNIFQSSNGLSCPQHSVYKWEILSYWLKKCVL